VKNLVKLADGPTLYVRSQGQGVCFVLFRFVLLCFACQSAIAVGVPVTIPLLSFNRKTAPAKSPQMACKNCCKTLKPFVVN
jgi:hypothetical protein